MPRLSATVSGASGQKRGKLSADTRKAQRQAKLGENAFVLAWRMAVNEYMASRPHESSNGHRIPKSGTPAHARLLVRQKELVGAARQRISEEKKRHKKKTDVEGAAVLSRTQRPAQRAIFLCERPDGGW